MNKTKSLTDPGSMFRGLWCNLLSGLWLRIWLSQAAKPHHCAQWVRSKPHSESLITVQWRRLLCRHKVQEVPCLCLLPVFCGFTVYVDMTDVPHQNTRTSLYRLLFATKGHFTLSVHDRRKPNAHSSLILHMHTTRCDGNMGHSRYTCAGLVSKYLAEMCGTAAS